MLVCVFCIRFSVATIELTVDEFEEGDFEDFQDNQGQATQGKPPLLVAYLGPSFTYASFPFMFIQRCIVLKLLLPLDSDSLATRLH
jgi:hypothetical protein